LLTSLSYLHAYTLANIQSMQIKNASFTTYPELGGQVIPGAGAEEDPS